MSLCSANDSVKSISPEIKGVLRQLDLKAGFQRFANCSRFISIYIRSYQWVVELAAVLQCSNGWLRWTTQGKSEWWWVSRNWPGAWCGCARFVRGFAAFMKELGETFSRSSRWKMVFSGTPEHFHFNCRHIRTSRFDPKYAKTRFRNAFKHAKRKRLRKNCTNALPRGW